MLQNWISCEYLIFNMIRHHSIYVCVRVCVPEEKAKTEINLGTICNDTKLQIEDENFQSQRIRKESLALSKTRRKENI